MRLLYSCVFYLLVPIILLRLLWRAMRAPDYRKRWAERFGFFSIPIFGDKVYWVHAVSVGETLAAVPMIKKIMAENSGSNVVITTTTPTGSAQVKSIFGDTVFHVYAPYDLPDCVARFLNKIRPSALIIMETELWPNAITACSRRNIPVILANGRLSEKSAQGYKKVSSLIAPMLNKISLAAMQYLEDAERIKALGVRDECCHVIGNIKFDLVISDAIEQQSLKLKNEIVRHEETVVWIAASTHPGEDEIILDVYQELKQKLPKLFLILVPRHPERFSMVAQLAEAKNFVVQRRSLAQEINQATDILIGDTMGELLMLYGVADFVFVGGSFVPVGGHNLMEPAAWALPIICGKHLHNFSQVSKMLQEQNAMVTVGSNDELSSRVSELAGDKSVRDEMGKNAFAVAEKNRGALNKLLMLITNTVAR